MSRILLFNKPFGVLCQFSPQGERVTLKAFVDVPGVYPAGRLDTDSEGLLVLTDDGRVQHRIADPRHKAAKKYLVQVDGEPGTAAIEALCSGVDLGDFVTRPAHVRRVDEPRWLWPRTPPIRERKALPTSWLELVIGEGKNRQVRRMTARVGHPTLRLIRTAVGEWTLGELTPGQWCEVAVPEAWRDAPGARARRGKPVRRRRA